MSHTDQSRAQAGGDIAGRDIRSDTTIHNYAAPRAATVVEQLLAKLHNEIEQDQTAVSVIDRLQRFHRQRAHDDVVGLEAKLAAAGRDCEYMDALEAKEMFAKLLERWSLYESAQSIFVYLLARAEQNFRGTVFPQLSSLSVHEINKLTIQEVVSPAVNDCGATVLEIDHTTAMGMVYWLAEQCFVRWHA